MILESISIIFLAVILDFTLGDPKSKYHPTAWIGGLIAKLTPYSKNTKPIFEKIKGTLLVLFSCFIVAGAILLLNLSISLISLDYLSLVISIIFGSILLKTTIAVRGMEKHALRVVECLKVDDLEAARNSLSMIVKRDTKSLGKNHVISGVIESISENTVDGITGPLFYYAVFGLPGAFVYRTINTIDSMIGYRNYIFKNVGWFGANCDKVLNYLPSRLTGLVMILSAYLLGNNWRQSFQIMIRDGRKTDSPNAGYPMAAVAGALETRFEKINYYSLGDGNTPFSEDHIISAIKIMKLTTILFCGIVSIPLITILGLLGWFIHA